MGTTSLATELVCACLAGDLGLPVPQPYLVQMDNAWVNSIHDPQWRELAQRSTSVAFGSRKVPAGFSSWIQHTSLINPLTDVAGAVLLFDAITDNPDRRAENPNCLLRGDEIRIIDHELALSSVPLLGYRPPWELGGLQHMERPGAHIFRDALHRRVVDWQPIRERWAHLSDGQLADYAAIIPPEWSASLPAVQRAITKITSARDQIDGCIAEVQRLIS
jgi:hypothetical protein